MLVFSTWFCATFRTIEIFVDQFSTLHSSNGHVKEPTELKQFAKYMQMTSSQWRSIPVRTRFWPTTTIKVHRKQKIRGEKKLARVIRNSTNKLASNICWWLLHWASTPARRGHQQYRSRTTRSGEQNSPEFCCAAREKKESFSRALLTSSRRTCFLLTITVGSSGETDWEVHSSDGSIDWLVGDWLRAWGHRCARTGNAHAQFNVYVDALWML